MVGKKELPAQNKLLKQFFDNPFKNWADLETFYFLQKSNMGAFKNILRQH